MKLPLLQRRKGTSGARCRSLPAITLSAFCLSLVAPDSLAALTWGDKGSKCEGPNRIEYARLWGLSISGGDWKKTCEATPARGVSRLSDGKRPSYCVDKKGLGVWGEWKYSNHPSCMARFEKPRPAGCFGPNRQVYSARLIGDTHGKSWEQACASGNGPAGFGKPDRCVKDALNTGIWGEWYSNKACTVPLKWGLPRDNGCVKDMAAPDANAGGISIRGMRSYSAVLWNVGGDWLEACRRAPARIRLRDGRIARFPYPTACTIADANDALSWVTTAVIGAGTAFISAPTGPYAIAASGAAISVVSKAVEGGLLAGLNPKLNVWGVFWVADSSCGVPDSAISSRDQATGASASSQAGPVAGGYAVTQNQLSACPGNAAGIRGTLSCNCSPNKTSVGTVWGSGTYTTDSSICRAAVHAGVIPLQGGNVSIRTAPGLPRYPASTQNGVTSKPWGPWRSSFSFQ